MSMRIYQARHERPAPGVDDIGVAKLQHFAVKQPFHPAIVTDQHARKAFKLAIRVDLDAVGVGYQRVCKDRCGSGGEEECKKC